MAVSAGSCWFWGVRSIGVFAPLVLTLGFVAAECAIGADNGVLGAGEYDRPGPNPHQSRSMLIAKHGIVATSQPLAAQTGLDVLKAGGNAIDAAIATNAMLGLTEPNNCGIGGDLFVIYWDAKTQKLYGLNACGRSPYRLNREVFASKNLKEIPGKGLLCWSVPGCVDGWNELSKRFGTVPLATLLAPAIQAAESGFAVTEQIARDWHSQAKDLEPFADSVATYLPGGRAPEIGEIFTNPNLARSYRTIAEQGRDGYYKGDIARQIVEFSEQNGGYFTLNDFADHSSTWIDPVSTNYRGYDVWEIPPNGQGIAVLEILNVLEGYDLQKFGRTSPDYLHALIEAKKLAFADRARYYADPDFAKTPVAELISKSYADKQRQRINPHKSAVDVPAGDPILAKGDTIYMTVVDKDRNCCSFIQSNFAGFGSQVVPGKVGFVMQNRGGQFNLSPSHPNTLEPHKRPFHTIIPAFVTKEGKPWFCFGVMGGDVQPQGHVQILVNMIDFGMNPQAAGDASRMVHSGSQTPTGRLLDEKGGSIIVESGIPDATIEALRAKGHVISRGGYFGGYQGILLDHKHGTLQGATESRTDGTVVGY